MSEYIKSPFETVMTLTFSNKQSDTSCHWGSVQHPSKWAQSCRQIEHAKSRRDRALSGERAEALNLMRKWLRRDTAMPVRPTYQASA